MWLKTFPGKTWLNYLQIVETLSANSGDPVLGLHCLPITNYPFYGWVREEEYKYVLSFVSAVGTVYWNLDTTTVDSRYLDLAYLE